MSTSLLDGKLFLRLVRDGAANLQQHAAIVNDLNVFPIPDGDTGDNMMLTVTGGLKGLSEEDDLSLAEASASLAHGMLLSARGNSGVILSQLFAGLAGGFQGMQKADTSAVCEALRAGVRRAYDAVLHPTEGTILTVAREAAEAVNDHLGEVSTLESLFEYYMASRNQTDMSPLPKMVTMYF